MIGKKSGQWGAWLVAAALLVVALSAAGPRARAEQFPAGVEQAAGAPGDPVGRAGSAEKDPTRIFVGLVMESWKKYYAAHFKDEYEPLSDEQLMQEGLRTFGAASLDEDNHEPMFAMIMLNWQARLLGASTAFIDDATGFYNESAGVYALRWYEYQLRLLERERRGEASPIRYPASKKFEIKAAPAAAAGGG